MRSELGYSVISYPSTNICYINQDSAQTELKSGGNVRTTKEKEMGRVTVIGHCTWLPRDDNELKLKMKRNSKVDCFRSHMVQTRGFSFHDRDTDDFRGTLLKSNVTISAPVHTRHVLFRTTEFSGRSERSQVGGVKKDRPNDGLNVDLR